MHNLPKVISPLGYGIANYMITTLNTLKAAKELPELYMKSKDEMILWRMLRRISDDIQLKLDNRHLDKASQVKQYKVKDIVIAINQQEGTLTFQKLNKQQTIALNNLHQNPTNVFKQLLAMVNIP